MPPFRAPCSCTLACIHTVMGRTGADMQEAEGQCAGILTTATGTCQGLLWQPSRVRVMARRDTGRRERLGHSAAFAISRGGQTSWLPSTRAAQYPPGVGLQTSLQPVSAAKCSHTSQPPYWGQGSHEMPCGYNNEVLVALTLLSGSTHKAPGAFAVQEVAAMV